MAVTLNMLPYVDTSSESDIMITWDNPLHDHQSSYEICYKLKTASSWSTLGIQDGPENIASLLNIFELIDKDVEEIYVKIIVYYETYTSEEDNYEYDGNEHSDVYSVMFHGPQSAILKIQTAANETSNYPVYDIIRNNDAVKIQLDGPALYKVHSTYSYYYRTSVQTGSRDYYTYRYMVQSSYSGYYRVGSGTYRGGNRAYTGYYYYMYYYRTYGTYLRYGTGSSSTSTYYYRYYSTYVRYNTTSSTRGYTRYYAYYLYYQRYSRYYVPARYSFGSRSYWIYMYYYYRTGVNVVPAEYAYTSDAARVGFVPIVDNNNALKHKSKINTGSAGVKFLAKSSPSYVHSGQYKYGYFNKAYYAYYTIDYYYSYYAYTIPAYYAYTQAYYAYTAEVNYTISSAYYAYTAEKDVYKYYTYYYSTKNTHYSEVYATHYYPKYYKKFGYGEGGYRDGYGWWARYRSDGSRIESYIWHVGYGYKYLSYYSTYYSYSYKKDTDTTWSYTIDAYYAYVPANTAYVPAYYAYTPAYYAYTQEEHVYDYDRELYYVRYTYKYSYYV